MMTLVALISTISFATQVVCDPIKTTHCSAPISKGEEAPMDGYILSEDLVIDLGQKAEAADLRVELATQKEKEIADQRVDYQKKLDNIDLTVSKREAEYWKERTVKAEHKPLIEKPIVIIAVTAITTVAVILVANKTIREANNW